MMKDDFDSFNTKSDLCIRRCTKKRACRLIGIDESRSEHGCCPQSPVYLGVSNPKIAWGKCASWPEKCEMSSLGDMRMRGKIRR